MNYKILIGFLLVLICSVSACVTAEELTDFGGYFKMNVDDGMEFNEEGKFQGNGYNALDVILQYDTADYQYINESEKGSGNIVVIYYDNTDITESRKDFIKDLFEQTFTIEKTEGDLTILKCPQDSQYKNFAQKNSTNGDKFVLVGGDNQDVVNKLASSVVFN